MTATHRIAITCLLLVGTWLAAQDFAWFAISGPAEVSELGTATYHLLGYTATAVAVNVDDRATGWDDDRTGDWIDAATGVFTPGIVTADTAVMLLVSYDPGDGSLPTPVLRQVTVKDTVHYHAVDDIATVAADATTNINVTANDIVSDGYSPVVTAVTPPLHGTVAALANAHLRYTPATGYTGPDAFTYTLGGETSATVWLTVAHAVDYPLASGWSAVGNVLTGTDTAAALAASVPGVTTVCWWDAAARVWRTWNAAEDVVMPLPTGTACLVADATGTTARLFGDWPTDLHYDLVPGPNFITLPLEQAALTSATALLGAIPTATGVWRWDPSTQRWQSYLQGFGGTDFPLAPGTPFVVAVTAPTAWPP